MRNWRWLLVAGMMALSAVAMAQPSRVSVPGPSVSVFCPELPPDCCRVRIVSGCRICTQSGCGG
jgi:hypothetical protein